MLERIFTFSNATMHHIQLNGTLSCSLVYQPLPNIWMEYAAKNGGNSLGTTPQQGNAFRKSYVFSMILNKRANQ